MSWKTNTALALSTILLTGLSAHAPVFAQQADQPETAAALADPPADSEEAEVERIVVTGSRLRRDEFSSVSPVQLIDASSARQIGIVDTTQMIAESPVVSGPQLDASTNAGSTTGAVEGVPANGPGASSVALRGLGPERTLLMVNGRRLAPSGVRGAPVAPDLNLIPSGLIDRIEILTDGASSIYGADAVAGVVNILLRDNVEGIELNAFTSLPEESGGEEQLISIVGGVSNNRGNFTVAAEFFNRDTILAGDRPGFNDCLRDIEVAPNGEVFSICQDRRPDNSAFVFGQGGFVFRTPGNTDIGIPGWSSGDGVEAQTGLPFALQDIYTLQDEERAAQLQGDLERINFYGTGEYDLDFWSNDTAYMELSYSQRQAAGRFASEQVFPAIPAMIPQVDENGAVVGMVDNPLNPFDTTALPVYSTQGLSQIRDTDIDQFRGVFGLKGDLAIPGLMERNWVYDAFVSFEESSGTSIQAGMFEPHVRETIDTLRMLPDGTLECGLPRTAPGFGFLTPRDCVVVDFFANSLFTITPGGDGTFATQEESDFLFGNVINTTTIEQTHISGLVTGDLFDLPAGTVGVALGGEYRENSIESINDFVRAQGLSASEAPDQEGDTIGEVYIWELYAEAEIPIHEMFRVNLSGRYTEEENFGDEFTYSIKADFTPLDWLRLRSTFGTTFRAPNLREQFLSGQAGVIAGGNDPCIVPITANNSGVYDPSGDTRTQRVLDNCVADGVDPTALGLQANVLIPTQTGGAQGALNAETSESFTFGAVLSQPFTDAFGFDFAITYYDIEIEDTVEELDSATVLARCYSEEPNLASPLCDRIQRRGVNPENNTVSLVDASFVNVGVQTSSGIDFNGRFTDDFSALGRNFDVLVSATATWQDELEEQFDPDSPVDDRVGEAGFPEWSWIANLSLATGPFDFTWRTRWIDGFAKDDEDIDLSANRDVNACSFLGGPVNADGNGPCVKKHFGGETWYHDASLAYNLDSWSFTVGVRNIFNEEPPLIDQGQGPARMNVVVQSGYDLFGRRLFLSASKRF